MPIRNVERNTSGYCKIRKRVSSSSSATSSFVRLKRPILVAKRVNSSTPLPTLKMDLRSPSVAKHGDKGKEAQMSARSLAATLWEINGGGEEEEEKENFKGGHSHMLDHSCSPLCKKDGSKKSRHRRRSSEKLQLIEYIGQGKDSVHHHGASAKAAVDMSSRLRDVSTSLTTSKELVKVLYRMWVQGERNSSNLTLVSALKVEIDRARHQVDHLMHEKRYYSQREIDALLKQFACEKRKDQERISGAVLSVARELEVEKKLRRQTERLNKTLGRELADTKDQLKKATEELGCERRGREMLQQRCDELASGLGEVEELKRECDEVREEAERERRMLQLADVLREERVQMKLADARYEYEEKNAALERMRCQLEAYVDESEEVNMAHKWSFANEGPAAEEMFRGRRSLCEKIQWENICLQRKASDGLGWDFNNRKGNANGEDCSMPLFPPELGDLKAPTVNSGDQIDDINDRGD